MQNTEKYKRVEIGSFSLNPVAKKNEKVFMKERFNNKTGKLQQNDKGQKE